MKLEITEEVKLPNSDVILEVGDRIEVLSEDTFILTFKSEKDAQTFASDNEATISYSRGNKISIYVARDKVDQRKNDIKDEYGDQVTIVVG